MNVEGSEAKHSFYKNGTDKSLYVFEAPIDLMSHMVLYPHGWLEHSYVACCGTSIQPVLERLRQNPKLDMVYLCYIFERGYLPTKHLQNRYQRPLRER